MLKRYLKSNFNKSCMYYSVHIRYASGQDIYNLSFKYFYVT